MKEFNLNLQYKQSSSTQAYIKIRWKTYFEKTKKEDQDLLKNQGEEVHESNRKITVISKFLDSECTFSDFASDYILIEDLQQRYDKY